MRTTTQPSQQIPGGGLLHATQSLLYLIVGAVFIAAFVVQPFQIPSGSMEPTLRIGDFVLVDKQLVSRTGVLPPTVIARGDVIVFHYPVDHTLHLVKRVIGVPGDRLRLRENHVLVNGQILREPYAVYSSGPEDAYRDNFPRMQSAAPGVEARWWIEMRSRIDHGDLVVPPGRYFVLGDNRNNSEDSRYWGFVDEKAVVGKPLLVYFSLREGEHAGLRSHRGDLNVFERLAQFVRWERTLRVVR